MTAMKAPPFAALAARIGVDLSAPPEPEPVDGPVWSRCPDGTEDEPCSGSLRIVARNHPIWELRCDRCGFEAGLPARLADPVVKRETRLARAGIPEAFAGLLFAADEDNRPVLKRLRTWMDSFDGSADPEKRPGTLLPAPAIYGQPGRGKTHLLATICVRVISECDLDVAFYSTRGLLADLQRFDNDVVRGRTWERALTVDVLALDDVGAERTTDWRLDQLAHLVDERYQRRLPIVLSTNYPPAQWDQVLDMRTVSRLRERTFQIELKGVDRRLQPEREMTG